MLSASEAAPASAQGRRHVELDVRHCLALTRCGELGRWPFELPISDSPQVKMLSEALLRAFLMTELAFVAASFLEREGEMLLVRLM